MPSAHSIHQFNHMPNSLEVLGASLPGCCDPALPLAVARSGGVGILNLVHHTDVATATAAAAELGRLANGRAGLLLSTRIAAVERAALDAIGQADLISLRNHDNAPWRDAIGTVRPHAHRVGAVVTSLDEAHAAIAAGCDLVVAKGHEAGGLVSEETSFVLVQALLANVDVPVYVWGGISWNTAAACAAAGCAGVLLDWQLALLRESPLGAGFRRRLSLMDGSEVATVALPNRQYLRFYHQPGMTARATIDALMLRAASMQPDEMEAFTSTLLAQIETLAAEPRDRDRLWLTGQDASLAADWARQAPSVGRALQLLAQRVDSQVGAAAEARILDAGSPLANSHGTRFPVVQGPMTRVSDVPEFCQAVAAEGGLPFLALALLGEAQVRSLLQRTKEQLGDLSWGVGMLGFVPQEIRAQQWPVIQEIRPPYAIIAGGRPDQAASLEANGIATYLHVPSPGMLDMFLREGARRFVFEGRECGGHVGPRTSFVLWELMVRVLSEANLSAEEAAKVHVLFAGGIHDRLGAAMVSVLAQPLVERGMKVGVLLGTAYLFTHEIVATGAIVEGFQSVAIDMQHTMVVESGPGHAVRCAPNDFVHLFEREKRRMVADGCPHEEMRAELEHLNLGRLRVAAKGVQRGEQGGGLVQVDGEGQLRDGMYMIGQVAALRQGACSLRELHEEVCLGAVETLAAHTHLDLLPATVSVRPKPLDIAVVGMSCLVPGATDPSRLWHNVLAKFDPITEIPPDRFEVDRWFNGDRKARDKIYGRWGGFVEDLPFDPLKYGIPPASIPSIEPMQLLAMELVDRALTDAGYAPHNPLRERTSIILGVGGGAGELGSTYAFRAMLPRFLENPDESLWQQLPEWTEDSFAGILFNVVAGRVSNRFDLGGANCTVDAACASSLSALYWACHDLASGNCDMVITGGCDTMQNPFGYLCFAKAGALSASGRARVFDTKADGIVISEGHAAVVLKRREDAERDGDNIYAVIRAVSGGSDGRSMGLTAPRVEGQLRTLRRAYEQAGVDPASVALFEAHGTGTAVGDQTESLSLTTLLQEAGVPQGSIAVGSIKSMIGHTKCAAGAVGLVKTIMAMQHRVLPPTMHVDSPNPKGGLVDGPLFVNTEARPWLAGEGPRRAGVSSFGFGGTNFHVLLEEYDRSPLARPLVARRDSACELFVLRADTIAALRTAARSLATEAETVLANKIPSGIARLAYTHHLRSQIDKPCQMAIVVGDLNELIESLRGFEAAVDDQGKVTGKLPSAVQFTAQPLVGGPLAHGKVAFLFPGQGSQFPGMLQELAVEYSEVAACFQRADDVLRPELGQALSQAIFPPSAFTDADRAAQVERLKDTRLAQPALGVSGRAVEQLLASFGVRPQMTAGHSFGELVALCSAGAMSETELFHLAAARGQGMAAGGEAGGTMLAVGADGATVQKHLADRSDVWIANLNSPRQTVLSGTESGIAHAQTALEAAGITARRIPVSAAFHSPFMQQPRAAFSETLAEASFAPPRTPVYANVSAETYSQAGGDVCLHLAEQLTDKVRWVEQIENMYRDGARIFVEVGAKGVLTGLVRDILKDREHVAIATQPNGASQVRHFLGALGQLISQGVDVSLDRLYDRRTLEPLTRKELTAGAGDNYPAHVWLVNGAYSRKVGAPLRSTAPLARLGAPAAESVHSNGHVTNTTEMTPPRVSPSESQAMANGPASNGHAHSHAATGSDAAAQPQPERRYDVAHGETRPAETSGHSPQAVNAASPAVQSGGSMDAHSYALFQETMRQFLATQQSVLSQLFGGGQSVASVPAHSVHAQPHYAEPVAPRLAPAAPYEGHGTPPAAPVAASPAAAVSHPRPAAAPAVQAELASTPAAPAKSSARFSADDLQTRLAATVADRTGYPAEMLSFDINLEAELGIDSIKRVEIIAAFCREALPEMLEPPAEFMERLAGAKTMRQIVDVVAEMSGADDAKMQPALAESPAIVAAAAIDPDDLLTTLLRIVADRTGYPAEMLDLDINLEGELGIDSIKRVEIIAAFRREVLPEMLEPPAQFMEQLAGAKTMRAIIDVVVAMSGAQNAPAQPGTILNQPVSGPSLAVDIAQLQPTLVRIVADRTGYPAEMLTGDVNLESELGIDSIKRVEIIAAFRREVRPDMVEAPPELMERLAGAKTVHAILACFTEPTSAKPATIKPPAAASGKPVSAPAAAVVDVATAELSAADACPRCVADIVDAPIAHVGDLGPGAVIVVASHNPAADSLIAGLKKKRLRVELLCAADLDDATTARAAVDRIRRATGSISAVAHILGLEECPAWPESDTALWNDRFNCEVRGLLFLLQALEPELGATADSKLRVLCASIGGSDFATDDSASPDASHAWRGGLAGLLKVAACEWPQHAFRAVDFTEQPDGDVLLQELTASGPVEIGYRDGRRLQIQTRRVELAEPALDHSPITADSTVIVTGGAKGITAAIVAELAKRVPARFILLGRSPLSTEEESPATLAFHTDTDLRKAIIGELRTSVAACTPATVEARLSEIKSNREVRRNLAAIAEAGGTVEYIPCDIRNAGSLKQMLADVQSRHGSIHGIIHGAGVIDDRAIKDKTAESFDRVVRTKVDPLLALLENVDRDALKLVALFSSTSGFFGNSGQCDYAAANEVLNRVARRLRATWNGKVVSFNWGPWAGAGMVTAEVAAKMRAGGVDLIPLSVGCAAACRELLNSEPTPPRVIMGRGPWLQDEQLRAGMDFSAYETLLGGPLEKLSHGGFVARVVLDRNSRYLQDHRIEGKAVLPVAMAVGLMAEAAHLNRPDWHVAAVENVRMLSGITIEHETREILVRVEPLAGEGQTCRWQVSIRPVEMPQRILYDAHVELSCRPPIAPEANVPDPIESDLEATASEAYDRWLFHGPSYKVIQAFAGADERGIDAIVRPGDDGASTDGLLDHVMIDAAPQLAMIWSRALFDVAVLPNRISSYRVYEPIGTGEVEMKLRIRPGSDRQVYNADVWIVRDGRLIAHMEGLEGAGSPQLNRIAVQL